MLGLLRLFLGLFLRCFCSRRDLLLENLVLRQQRSVFKQRKPRPMLASVDKLFWVGIKRVWSQWKNSLVVVTPETVARGTGPVSEILALALSPPGWAKARQQGSARPHFSNGRRRIPPGVHPTSTASC